MSEKYIEKEAAIRNFCKGCGIFDTDNCICTGKVRCDEYDAILDIPPADVAPVVRGEWISWEEMFPDRQPVRKGLGVFCSVCKKHSDWPDEYCHRCGATMINSESYEDEEEVDIDDSDGEPDWCYECTGYGDDYSLNEDGELVHNCDSCKFNPLKDDEDE